MSLSFAQTYGPFDYFGEIGDLVQAMGNDEAYSRARNLLIGPNLAGDWPAEDIWNTGFVDTYSDNLAFLAVEQSVINLLSVTPNCTNKHTIILSAILPTIASRNLVLEHSMTPRKRSRHSSITTRASRSYSRTSTLRLMLRP